MPTDKILEGDVLSVLKTLTDESVDCVITSPPYWGLRDYGVVGQLGLENTPEGFVANLVGVLREVKRVLKERGTLWLNLGDSYSTKVPNGGQGKNGQRASRRNTNLPNKAKLAEGIKPKDLVGIPWMVAFALRADGWYLRQDIIWHKPNPMPESVKDRCTKAHEYIFLLAKSEKYYYDVEAIREPAIWGNEERLERVKLGHKSLPNVLRNGLRQRKVPQVAGWGRGDEPRNAVHFNVPKIRKGSRPSMPNGSFNGKTGDKAFRKTGEYRNKRSVWSVSSKPFKEAHFATFPEALIAPMILAGCPMGGVCLDPFMGAGTTAVVAKKLGRHYVGIEINAEYIKIAEKRISGVTPPLF